MTKIILGVAISIMVAGGGVGLIAQEAKPGDMLYGFKTSINEKIAGLFMMKYTAKVDYEVDLLEERLQEIDELVKEGKMSGEDAVLARAHVIAQLEKASRKITEAGSQTLTAAERGRVSASLTRLQAALAKYRSSLNTLDIAADAAIVAKPTLSVRGSRSKSVASTVADVSVVIEETAFETLDVDIDISEGYDEEAEETVNDSPTEEIGDEGATDEGNGGGDETTDESTVDEASDDDMGTSTDDTTIEVEGSIEIDVEGEVDTTVN